MSLITNPSFEGLWTDDIIGATTNQIPAAWNLTYIPIGEDLRSKGMFSGIDHEPLYEVAETTPEAVHKGLFDSGWNLPDDERLGGENALILEGVRTYNVFSSVKAYGIQLDQTIQTPPGSIVKLTWPVNVHNQGDGSPGAAAWRIGLNDSLCPWKTFKVDFTDREWQNGVVEALAPSNGLVKVIGQFESRSLAGIDFFMDNITLEISAPPVEDGTPRIQYERTYLLLPGKDKLSSDEYTYLLGLLSNNIYNNQWTFGFSADDAGIGSLNVRKVVVVSLHEDDWDEDALIKFYTDYYPGVTVEFYSFEKKSNFPVGTDQYPPKAWYVPPTQLFNAAHRGVDFNLDVSPWGDVERGFPILAVLDGTVYYTTEDWSGVGMCIIEHEFEGRDYYVQYAHVDLVVSEGDPVIAGQIIGHIANWVQGDGGDHLHFGVSTEPVSTQYMGWEYWIDPIEWLKRFQPTELVDAAIAKDTVIPPPIIEPPISNILRSNNLIGLHSGFQKQGWDEYLINAKPTTQKVFSLGFAIEAKTLAPEALVIYRKFVSQGLSSDFKTQAKWLVDVYSEEVMVTARNMGISEEKVLSYVDVFESMNETVPSLNRPEIEKAVALDYWFAEYLDERYGTHIKPGLLTVAIGNPHETEVELLLPAVEQVVKYEGFVGYHSYWSASESRSFLTEHWKFHAGRWAQWDIVFNKHGLYPKYYFGEGGIVYAPDGLNFNSGRGWRSCGSIEDYIKDLDTFNTLVLEWNKAHNNRAYGLNIFCFGSWGWENFEMGTGDLKLIEEHFKKIV